MSRKLHNDARPGAAGGGFAGVYTREECCPAQGACVLALAVGGGPDSRYNAIR